jgi:ubiquinone/menaquinone biosynthesis C-methylase UbiE
VDFVRDFRQRLFARFYDRVQASYDARMAPLKEALFADLSGTVVEIGPGTGANLLHLPRDVHWIGIEPNPHMQARLRQRAAATGIAAEFRPASAQGLELDDASVDVVLSTLVLCSVPDPAAVLVEVRRVLRPGGRFVFIEHVAAPRGTRLWRMQRLLGPLWSLMADGCRPDRELGVAIRAAGFGSLELEEFRVVRHSPLDLVGPHVAGVARK